MPVFERHDSQEQWRISLGREQQRSRLVFIPTVKELLEIQVGYLAGLEH